MFYDTASALFGVEGLRVTDVEAGPGGVVEVWAVTDCQGAPACPDCGTESSRVHELVVAAAQFGKVIETLDADGHGQEIAIAWIAKEKLRGALNLRARISRSQPCERQARDRLFAFYDWCAQNEAIPKLVTLASTVSRWEEQIVTAVLTGVTNATSESLNRLAKLEARLAYGFRNPASQRRRVRTSCTRGTRRPSPTASSSTKRTVTSKKQVSG